MLDFVDINWVTEQFFVVAEQYIAGCVDVYQPLLIIFFANLTLLKSIDPDNVET